MEGQMAEMDNRIRTSIETAMGADKRDRSINEAIPIYSDPDVRPVVDMLYTQAMVRYKKDQPAAIASVRKTLQSMGIDWQGRGSGNQGGGNRSGNSMRRGSSALDSFAPLPSLGNGGNGQPATRRLIR